MPGETTFPPPLPPPAPVQPISYRDDSETSRPWAQLVRIVATVGVVVASASLAQIAITTLPAMGMRSPWTVSIRMFVPQWLNVIPSVLLLAGGTGCLSLRPFGRPLMIAYAVAALAVVLVSFCFLVFTRLGLPTGSPAAGALILYYGFGSASSAAAPTIILVLMTRPQVKRVFVRG